jgi:alanine racemase
VWADIDLDAVRANVRALRTLVAPSAVLAVVKADGYGHGAVPVAHAALDAGATMLGVALVEEGVALRDAGVSAPVLVLSEPVPDAAHTVVQHRLTPAVYTERGIEALAKAVAEAGAPPLPVHLKVDTGMHRVGATPDDAVRLAQAINAAPELEFEGLWTHLAVADELASGFTDAQLDRFEAAHHAIVAVTSAPTMLHAANTAGALAHPRARLDLVRAGIGIYGVPPASELDGRIERVPAMRVTAGVSHVKPLRAGEGVSYGLRYAAPSDTTVATVPIGYADGVPRNLGHVGGAVLVHGRRCPIAGTVTMDQLMVDVGDLPVQVGDEVVLLGEQGGERIEAAEWADRLGTIAYEIVCSIGPRVPRRYSR